jgi:hypothetical protein
MMSGSFHTDEVGGVALVTMHFPNEPSEGVRFELPRTPGPTAMLPQVAEWQFASDESTGYFHTTGGTYHIVEWTPERITMSAADASFCAYFKVEDSLAGC